MAAHAEAAPLAVAPSGSWRLRPLVAACNTAAGGAAGRHDTGAARGVPLRALSPCCSCEDSGSGTPRARASAQGGFRRLRAGQLFELTPTLKGAAKVRCQRSSRRTGQRGLTAGLPPPRAGLPAT